MVDLARKTELPVKLLSSTDTGLDEQELQIESYKIWNSPPFNRSRKLGNNPFPGSSDIELAKKCLIRQKTIASSVLRPESPVEWQKRTRQDQTTIVERFLEARKSVFGQDEIAPLNNWDKLEDRRVFIVIRMFNERRNIQSCIESLLRQENFDLGKMVILVVDNNSTDGSAEIVDNIIQSNNTAVEIRHLYEKRQGLEEASRFGADTAMATIAKNSENDPRVLDESYIATVDADTVSDHYFLNKAIAAMKGNPSVGGVINCYVRRPDAQLCLFRSRHFDPTGSLKIPSDNNEALRESLAFVADGGVALNEAWKFHSTLGIELFWLHTLEQITPQEMFVLDTTSGSGNVIKAWLYAACGGIHQLKGEYGKNIVGGDFNQGQRLRSLGVAIKLVDVYQFTETDRLWKWLLGLAKKDNRYYGEMKDSTEVERTMGTYEFLKDAQTGYARQLKDVDESIWKDAIFPERLKVLFRFTMKNIIQSFLSREAPRQKAAEDLLSKLFSAEQLPAVKKTISAFGRQNIQEIDPDKAYELGGKLVEELYPSIVLFYKRTLQEYFVDNQVQCPSYILDVL